MFRQKRHKNELLLKEKLYKYWAICLAKKKKKKKKKQGPALGLKFQMMRNERGPQLEH